MIYDGGNALGAPALDTAKRNYLPQVISIDVETATVMQAEQPLSVVDGKVATFATQYEVIKMVADRNGNPCVFICFPKIPCASDVQVVTV